MATITETPKQELEKKAPTLPARAVEPAKISPPISYRPLFADSLLEKGAGETKRKGFTTVFSFSFQIVLLAVMAIIPLMFTEALPKTQLLTFLVAPPPPPPPPPPAAPKVQAVRETDLSNSGSLRTPSRIPQKIQMIKEEDTPPPAMEGVVGGVPGGIPGGQVGGVIGSIIGTHNMTAVPKLEPPKRVRVSQGVTQGMLVRRIEPLYPKIALAARVTGSVQLKAIIGKDGGIRELEVVSGHPILIPSAMDAVKQWRYRPYLLNGEAVEVETNITVTFQISG